MCLFGEKKHNSQGFSLLELVIASALLGMVLAGTFSVFTTTTNQIGSIATSQLDLASQEKAFQLLYAAFNDPSNDLKTDLATQTGNNLTLDFVTGSQSPTVTASDITIGDADDSLSGLLIVTPISEHDYDDTYCRVTGQNSDQTFAYTCPGVSYNGVVEASLRGGSIAFLSGELCKLDSTQTTQSNIGLDDATCLQTIPNASDTSAWEGIFLVPAVVVTSSGNTNPQSIFTSLTEPDDRISGAYPTL